MDSQPTTFHAVEEMEERAEVPKDNDKIRLQASGSPQSLGQDEQMAISQQEGGALRVEPQMVQATGVDLST